MSDAKPINDGGAAFPLKYAIGMQPGMTLRDWFAGQALTGLIASGVPVAGKRELTALDYAPVAYQMADAMIAQRAKGGAS